MDTRWGEILTERANVIERERERERKRDLKRKRERESGRRRNVFAMTRREGYVEGGLKCRLALNISVTALPSGRRQNRYANV